jgi:hypothetical protein
LLACLLVDKGSIYLVIIYVCVCWGDERWIGGGMEMDGEVDREEDNLNTQSII